MGRELFIQSGLRFPEQMSVEDLALVPRLLYYIQSQSKEALFIPEQLFYYRYRAGSLNNERSKIAIRNLARAIGILDDWGRVLEEGENCLLRQGVSKDVEEWFARYSEDSGLLTELINLLPTHYIARYILQIRENRWYRFGQVSRKRKLWMLGKVLSKKMGLYELLRPWATGAKKIMRKLGKQSR